MSLSAWEKQALDAIKDGLAGSDPELAALMSAFTRLADDEEMPDLERVPTSRRGPPPFPGGRWFSSACRACQHLGFLRAALLLVWMLTIATAIAVTLVLNAGDHGTCPGRMAIACAGPGTGHSPGSPSHNAPTSQTTQQPAERIPQAGP